MLIYLSDELENLSGTKIWRREESKSCEQNEMITQNKYRVNNDRRNEHKEKYIREKHAIFFCSFGTCISSRSTVISCCIYQAIIQYVVQLGGTFENFSKFTRMPAFLQSAA